MASRPIVSNSLFANTPFRKRGEVKRECVHKAFPAIRRKALSRTSNREEPSSINTPPLKLLRPSRLRDPESSTRMWEIAISEERLARIGKFTTLAKWMREISRPCTRSNRKPLVGYQTRKAFSGGAIAKG